MDAELREVVAAALTEHETPGCVVGLATGDRVEVEGFGLANVETAMPFTAETRVPIASMTKPYTATAVMALVEAGRLSLEDPVRRRLPEFRLRDAAAAERVTVRHLLTHTAGWAGDRGDMKELDADRGNGAIAAAVAALAGEPQVTAVGEQWSYSNSAYVVAGRLVEALCDSTFEAAVERIALAPLGLDASSFFVERAVTHPLAVGHALRPDGGFDVIRWPWACDRATNPSGGLISTAGDQLRWARWWAGTPLEDATAPLTAATRAAMTEPQLDAGCMCDRMGIGWLVDEVDGTRVVHHGGTLWGIQTESLFVPDAGVALVVLTNADGGIGVQRRVREHVLARHAGLDVTPPAPIAASASALSEYAGAYRRPVIGGDDGRFDVAVAGQTLVVTSAGAREDGAAPVAMRLAGADRAVLVEGPLAGLRAEFLRGDDGAVAALRFGARIAPRLTGTATRESAR